MKLRWLSVLPFLMLSGCDDPLTKVVNAKFPPVSLDQQRRVAIETTAAALANLTTPGIAVAVKLSDAQLALKTEQLKKIGILSLEIVGEEQLLDIRTKFDRTFDGTDAAGDENLRALLDRLKPHVVGTISISAGLTGAVVDESKPVPELEIRLLPSLGTISVEKIILAEKIDVTLAGEALAALLNKYKDNISGELSRSPLTRVAIPALAPKPVDLKQKFQVANAGITASVDVQAAPIVVPVKLSAIALSVTDTQITSIIQLSPRSGAPAAPKVEVRNTFTAIRDQIADLVEHRFGVNDATKTNWVAIRKDLLASAINDAVSQANLCISVNAQSARQTASSKVKLPDGGGIDCSPDRNCDSSRSCDFAPSVDTRDCDVCILSRPRVCSPRVCVFGNCIGGDCTDGGCIQRGRDPACALAQGVQNDLFRAEAAGKKLDCERLKSTEKLTCEAEKAGKKLLCETGKEALNRIAATGNFANLDVSTEVRTNGLKVCLRDFKVSAAFDNVGFALDVNGTASADVDVKFVPLDIVGHLVCQFPFIESKTFTASLRESRVNIASSVGLVLDSTKAHVDFAVQEIPVKARLSPSPAEFLLTSVNMNVSCTGMDLVRPLVVSLTPFIPELRGEIENKVPAQSVSTDLELPAQSIGDLKLQVTARDNPLAFIVAATPAP